MSFPAYESYKESGVEWLGRVPDHWNCPPLKHLVTMRSGSTPSKEREDYWGGEIPWASAKDLKVDTLIDTQDHLTAEAVDEGAAQLLPGNAVVVLVRGMMLARTFPVCRLSRPMTINQDLKGLLPHPGVDPNYLAWSLRASEVETLSRLDEAGHGTKALRMDAWATMEMPAPSLPEQRAIAAFLDRETAKIDALVEAQERLIALLKEKRQAVISHAVTKGLDPSAPMKDSGVEWLGRVPAHWKVTALKRSWSVTDCKHVTAEFVDEGVPVASIREVQARFVDLRHAKQTTDGYYALLVEGGREPAPGDLIFSRNATVGEVAEVSDQHPPFAMGQDVCLLRRQVVSASSAYLYHVIRSQIVQEQLAVAMIGSTFKRVNVEEIRNLTIPVPPPEEQVRIADHVEGLAAEAEALVRQAEVAIDLLQERRAALISAAITGKIDVRDLAQTAEAA